jgi:hypothetical protein
MVANMTVEFSDEALVGDKYAWGQRYGGAKINKLARRFKEELSKKHEAVLAGYNFGMLISNIH